jgi:hypothetical protein
MPHLQDYKDEAQVQFGYSALGSIAPWSLFVQSDIVILLTRLWMTIRVRAGLIACVRNLMCLFMHCSAGITRYVFLLDIIPLFFE